MRIRPLKWIRYDDGKTLGAVTPFGRYWIEQVRKGEFYWNFRDNSEDNPDNFKVINYAEAKHQCHTDWLKRIKPIFIGRPQ